MKSYIPYEGALLNPRRDRTFKAIFGGDSPDARFALKSFLEAIFEKEVCNIQLGPNELSGDDEAEKILSLTLPVLLMGSGLMWKCRMLLHS